MSSQDKYISIKQVRSAISRNSKQRETLKGLGLNKMNKVSVLKDTPSVRGMINKVIHLIEIRESS